MEPYLTDLYKKETDYLMDNFLESCSKVNQNPFLSQDESLRRQMILRQQYELEYNALRNRMEQALATGVMNGQSSWMEAESEIKRINTKKINGKKSCPELYRILKSKKINHS